MIDLFVPQRGTLSRYEAGDKVHVYFVYVDPLGRRKWRVFTVDITFYSDTYMSEGWVGMAEELLVR